MLWKKLEKSGLELPNNINPHVAKPMNRINMKLIIINKSYRAFSKVKKWRPNLGFLVQTKFLNQIKKNINIKK